MKRTTLVLAAVIGGVLVLFGGIALGNVLGDDSHPAATSPESVAIASATPADPDGDPSGPTEPFWPEPSPLQVPLDRVEVSGEAAGGGGETDLPEIVVIADEPDSLEAIAYDPETGIDSTAEGEIYLPPTFPPGTGPAGAADTTSSTAASSPSEPGGEGPLDASAEIDVDALFAEVDAPLLSPGDFVFRDPCADRSEGDEPDPGSESGSDCPEGIGGTIALTGGGGPPDPLAIMGQFYTSLTSGVPLRCDDLGVGDDGAYRAVFASNNPADFTIRYWATRGPRNERSITMSTSEEEVSWWIARRVAGEPVGASPLHGVHNCVEFPDLMSGLHMAFEIHGVDELGSEYTAVFYMRTPEGLAGADERPISFTPSNSPGPLPAHDVHGLLMVPYDDRTETVYMAPIPKNGPRGSALSCTDIEGEVLEHRHRSDTSLVDVRHGVLARRPGSDLDPTINRVIVGYIYPEEGTTYEICAWVAQPAVRSFDRPTVIRRESFLVRAPRSLRVRIWLADGRTDEALDPRSVSITATNWASPMGRDFPDARLPSGTFAFDEPFVIADSGSMPVPGRTLLAVTGPAGRSVVTEVPTPTHCPVMMFFACPTPGTARYDVQIPGRLAGRGLCGSSFEPCEPPTEQTYIGNLRLTVERYAGPGGPPSGDLVEDGWIIRSTGRFAGDYPAERPATPQIDRYSSGLSARPGGPGEGPGMSMTIQFDRPVRVEATPRNNRVLDCVAGETQSTTEYAARVSLTWRDLCYRGDYSISLLAVDVEGNELDLRTHIDGERTGEVGFGHAILPGFPVESFDVEITVSRLGDGIRPQAVDLTVDGVATGPFVALGNPPRCVTDAYPMSRYTRTVRDVGGETISLGDPMFIALRVAGTGDSRYGCGLEESHVVIGDEIQVTLDELLVGPVTLVHDDSDAEITVVVSRVVPR